MEQEMRESSGMKIKINAITGTAAEIDVKDTDSIQQLKEKIHNSLHISPELQRITFKDKVLENGLLMDYGVRDGSSLTLSLVMKAGTASATKRSLNIDQKSVSEIIRSLPQEQLSALLNQKKPVTITAKIGDHVVVFTLVPSDCQETDKESSPSSPSCSSSHHNHQQEHRHHNHSSSSNSSRLIRSTHQQVLSEEPTPTNFADKVELIRKRLSSIRKIEEMSRQASEQVQDGRIKKQKKPANRLLRRSKNSWKRSLVHKEKISHLNEEKKEKKSQQQQEQSSNKDQSETSSSSPTTSDQVDQEMSIKDCLVSEPSTPLPDSISSTDMIFSSPSGNIVPCLKCSKCTKKLKPTQSFTCKCGQVFCINHRHQNFNISSEKGHNCSFDFKTHGREELRASNPLIQGPKIQHI